MKPHGDLGFVELLGKGGIRESQGKEV